MYISNEEDLLDLGYRVQCIKHFQSQENTNRKKEHKKRYDIFKDNTKKYVVEKLKDELTDETFAQMEHRTANISILRKIIDKKSIVYKDGAIRIASNDNYQELIDVYTDLLNINTRMKRVNRYLELSKNCVTYTIPYKDPMTEKYSIMMRELLPYLYDVIPDKMNQEIPRVFVLSHFEEDVEDLKAKPVNESGNREAEFYRTETVNSPKAKDGIYIWWSNKYHFTTDVHGEIISPREEIENPIGMLPFVNFTKDQDGYFFAKGGQDLVEGSILVNQLLTDLYFIAKLQGQGIFYMAGKGLPKRISIGPSNAIIVNKEEGDPSLDIGFATSSPPLESHLRIIEQHIALMLSANNLEPSTIKGDLNASNAASGIQEIIRRSENIDSITDQQEIFRDQEPLIFNIITKWHHLMFDKGLLDPALNAIGKVPEDSYYNLKFPTPSVFMSEKDKLDIIKERLDLNLDNMVDALIRDNPDLSEEEAVLKLQQNLDMKARLNRDRLLGMMGAQNGIESNQEIEVERSESEVE